MKTFPMKGPGSTLAMAPEGPEIIAHGFSRGKGDGTRGALEGRYKRLLLSLIGARINRRSYVGASRRPTGWSVPRYCRLSLC